MSAITDAVQALVQGMAYQKFGLDYKQKQQAGQTALEQGNLNLQKTGADIAHTNAETQGVGATTENTQATTAHTNLQAKMIQDQLDTIEEGKKATDALAAAGRISSANAEARKALADQQAQELQAKLNAANVAHLGAETSHAAGQNATELEVARIHAAALAGNRGSKAQFAVDPSTGKVRWFQQGELDQTPGAGPKPSAADASVTNQGNKILTLRDSLLTKLQDPQIAAHLGPYQGRKNALEQMKGDPDVETQKFIGELESFLEMQGKLHGLRGQKVADNFRHVINAGHFTPQALAAGIQGVSAASEAFTGAGDGTRNRANDVLNPTAPVSGSPLKILKIEKVQ